MTAFYTSKEEYNAWLAHPTTKKYQEMMKDVVKTNREALGKKMEWKLEDTFKSGVLAGIEQAWDIENFFEFKEGSND